MGKIVSKTKTVALIVLDGWGYREDSEDNAVAAARKPFFDSIWKKYPHSLLEASGLAVGLPVGQMGNSEVGHTTIGAGAILDTDLVRIDKAANAGDFAKNPAMVSLFEHVKKHAGKTGSDATLHAMGLVSDGGVHSHMEHLFAFLRAARKAGVKKIAIHAFTDGRDTAPQSAAGFIKKLEKEIAKLDPSGKQIFIASLSGRYFSMDRDNNWDRMKKAATVIFEPQTVHVTNAAGGTVTKLKPSVFLEKIYAEGKNDELLEPVVIEGLHGKGAPLGEHDGIFVFNFRADRVRMLAQKLAEIKKTQKKLDENFAGVHIAAMTEYSRDYDFPIAFAPKTIETTLAAQVSAAGLTQAHIAETEKFPHATYFLNGGRNEPHEGEEHIMLASRKDVKTHDQAPEMRAEAIADKAIEQIKADTNFIFINFANPDMVGHTANVPAIITAIETVDRELKRVIDALEQAGGAAIIIADHGNAEVNVDPKTGTPHTAHTTNLVPCILAGDLSGKKAEDHSARKFNLKNGGLADVAPTILELLHLKKPKAMTGSSLLTK
jgi:2,3-bisphosphoglycerate-independent phosphoglycerate mutase